jgi:hypothetical protein
MPLLDATGNAGDPILQELFAQLLASAVEDEAHQQPSYIETVRRMSPTDARNLMVLASKYRIPIPRGHAPMANLRTLGISYDEHGGSLSEYGLQLLNALDPDPKFVDGDEPLPPRAA